MIINQINVYRITVDEREDHSPIACHRHRPLALSVMGEGVQLETRKIHVFGLPGIFKCA